MCDKDGKKYFFDFVIFLKKVVDNKK